MDAKEVIRREVGRRMAAPWSSDEVFADHIYDALTRASLLASPEMVEAAEACKEYEQIVYVAPGMHNTAKRVANAGAALLAAERPKGPWRVDYNVARNDATGEMVAFYDKGDSRWPKNVAAFVAEQNAREAR